MERNEEVQKLYDGLKYASIKQDSLNRFLKERQDFGFEALLALYENAIDELTHYKDKYEQVNDSKTAIEKKQNFYKILKTMIYWSPYIKERK